MKKLLFALCVCIFAATPAAAQDESKDILTLYYNNGASVRIPLAGFFEKLRQGCRPEKKDPWQCVREVQRLEVSMNGDLTRLKSYTAFMTQTRELLKKYPYLRQVMLPSS